MGTYRIALCCLATAALGAACSSTTSTPAPAACAESGSFTNGVTAGVGGTGVGATAKTCSCQPASLSVTVNWGSDGSGTINGQSCKSSLTPFSEGGCFVNVTCCVTIADGSGLPLCKPNDTTTIATASFLAKEGQSPSELVVLNSNGRSATSTLCECPYCGPDGVTDGACK
jgi:hypothetical protein